MEGLILIALYGLGCMTLVALAFLLYTRSVASRRQHVCSQCGEKQTVELMEATRCNACGAPFEPSPH